MATALTPEKKDLFGKAKAAFASMTAAYASAEAGEEGADKKLAEAKKSFDALGTMPIVDTVPEPKPVPVIAPDKTVAHPVPQGDGSGFAATIKAEFAAEVQKLRTDFASEQAKLVKENQTLTLSLAGLVGKSMRTDFASWCDTQIRAGLQFDVAIATKNFDSCLGDPTRIANLKELLLASPKRDFNADGGRMFGVDAASKPADAYANVASENFDAAVADANRTVNAGGGLGSVRLTNLDVLLGMAATGVDITKLVSKVKK